MDDTTLGNSSDIAPGDAFEVALLDANEKTSLVDTAVGLTRTDQKKKFEIDDRMWGTKDYPLNQAKKH